ncbi:hypothetical protein HK097_001641, partial [Rhizophlyctis rosea]
MPTFPPSLDTDYCQVRDFQPAVLPQFVVTTSSKTSQGYNPTLGSQLKRSYPSDGEEESVTSIWDRSETRSASPPSFPSPLSLSPVATDLSDETSEDLEVDRDTKVQKEHAPSGKAAVVAGGDEEMEQSSSVKEMVQTLATMSGAGIGKRSCDGEQPISLEAVADGMEKQNLHALQMD